MKKIHGVKIGLILSSIFLIGCAEKAPSKIESGIDNTIENEEEFKFYDLKKSNNDKNLIALPSLESLPLWQHDLFIGNVKAHLLTKNRSILEFNSNWSSMTLNLKFNSILKTEQLEEYIAEYATVSKKMVDDLATIYPNEHYKLINISMILPDSSELKTTFNIDKLTQVNSDQTYLILQAVDGNLTKLDQDLLSRKSIQISCTKILSKELTPNFCGEIKKVTIAQSLLNNNKKIFNDAKKTHNEKYNYGYDGRNIKPVIIKNEGEDNSKDQKVLDVNEVINEVNADINNEAVSQSDAIVDRKSDLTKHEEDSLKDAGFDIDL